MPTMNTVRDGSGLLPYAEPDITTPADRAGRPFRIIAILYPEPART